MFHPLLATKVFFFLLLGLRLIHISTQPKSFAHYILKQTENPGFKLKTCHGHFCLRTSHHRHRGGDRWLAEDSDDEKWRPTRRCLQLQIYPDPLAISARHPCRCPKSGGVFPVFEWCLKKREVIWTSLHTLWVVMPTQSDARKIETGACRFTDARNVGATPARPRAIWRCPSPVESQCFSISRGPELKDSIAGNLAHAAASV